jgi:hypothetical protein
MTTKKPLQELLARVETGAAKTAQRKYIDKTVALKPLNNYTPLISN